MSTQPAVIALDLGGTKLAGGLFTSEGKLLHKTAAPLAGRQARDVGQLMHEQTDTLLRWADENNFNPHAVGVCVPGISYPATGRVWAPNIPGWEDYPLRDEIAARLNGRNIPVAIDSDRACYILGEAWQGAARDCRHAIFLAVGTGIGAGILINGEVLRGAHDIAGAIGWLALDRPFRLEYKDCGCFEYHASGAGLAKVACELLAADTAYAGALRHKEDLTSRDIFDAFETGDGLAAAVLNQAIEFWGMAAANLVSLFNPEKIIFGGGVFGPAQRFLGAIQVEAEKWAQPVGIRQVKLESSTLGGDAGLIGAASLALRAAVAQR